MQTCEVWEGDRASAQRQAWCQARLGTHGSVSGLSHPLHWLHWPLCRASVVAAVTHPSAVPAAPHRQAHRGDLFREEERVGTAMGGWEAVTALAGGFGFMEQSCQSLLWLPLGPWKCPRLAAGSPIPSCLLGLRQSFPCWALPSLWDEMPGGAG